MLSKRPNETDLQYHKRLVYGKLVDRTLADVDFSELAPLLYDGEYNSHSARKMMYGSCKTLQLLDKEAENKVASSDIISELDAKKIELQKERQRFADQRRELNKLISVDGRFEHLTDALVHAAETLNKRLNLAVWGAADYEKVSGNSEAVLVFCDWHYGLNTKNIWNTYNSSVCIERVNEIVDNTIYKLSIHQPRRLHILLLGDMLHGAIHTSARVASEELVCDQLMEVSEIIAQAIAALASHVPEIVVHSTYGNHARTVQNKNDSIHRDNMERIIPWWLSQRLRDLEHVIFADPGETELITTDVCGHGLCASHGDLDYVKDAPRLFSTLLAKATGRSVDIVVLADKHHCEEFEEMGVTSMIADALCGTDDHAHTRRLYSSPGQLLFFVNERGLDAVYRMRCARE